MDSLSLYESTDLVRSIFKKHHSRELSTDKAREIASAVAQGREYFAAASEAGLLVRPLLQYYGVLSLSRSLILLRSPNLRETSLCPAHGVSPDQWVLVAGNLTDLRVKINTKGTFVSMLESTENADLSAIFTGPYPSRFVFAHPRPITTLCGISIAFQPLLSRISELRDIYERSFDQCASNYPAFVFTLRSKQTDIDLFYGPHGLPPEEQLRQELSIPAGEILRKSQFHNLSHQGRHLGYRLVHQGVDLSDLLPQIDNHPDGTMSIVVPFPGGYLISRIGRYFLLSFFLGTLARYYPTSWLSIMQSRQRGDLMLPIIREAMSAIQEHFPALIIDELER